MDRIIEAILGSEVPVIAWVAPEGARAGSAATFVTLAGDVAAMAPNTSIGAASVVGSGGEDLPETLAGKVTNDAVARIRSLANAHGRNADWAEDGRARGGQHRRRRGCQPWTLRWSTSSRPTTDKPASRRSTRGERADGQPYEFNGEPLPNALAACRSSSSR